MVALDWVCLHFPAAVLFLGWLVADWLPSLPAFRVADKLLARAVAAFISAAVCRCGSRWQARLTNQLYSYYIAAQGPICNADGVPVLMLEAVMYSLLSPNHEGSWWTWRSTRGRSFISLPPAERLNGRTDGRALQDERLSRFCWWSFLDRSGISCQAFPLPASDVTRRMQGPFEKDDITCVTSGGGNRTRTGNEVGTNRPVVICLEDWVIFWQLFSSFAHILRVWAKY